jgi:nucleoside-diphosphate-sugar epimerase
MKNKRVLITGITGFTGFHLSAELYAHGYDVWGTSRISNANPKIYTLDLTSSEAIAQVLEFVRPEIIIHMAGVSFVDNNDISGMYAANIVGTRNLLSVAVDSKCPPELVVIPSTSNVYAPSIEQLNEESSLDPANDYAISKLAVEYVANLLSDRLKIIVTRPFNYTGLGQNSNFLVPKIIYHFQQRKTFINLGNIDVTRDISDVRTVSSIYRLLIEKNPASGIYNICSGKPVSIKEIIDTASSVYGHQLDIISSQELRRSNDIVYQCGDQTKLRNTIGDFKAYCLEDTLNWFRQSMGEL